MKTREYIRSLEPQGLSLPSTLLFSAHPPHDGFYYLSELFRATVAPYEPHKGVPQEDPPLPIGSVAGQ